jgi:hypothetical protein
MQDITKEPERSVRSDVSEYGKGAMKLDYKVALFTQSASGHFCLLKPGHSHQTPPPTNITPIKMVAIKNALALLGPSSMLIGMIVQLSRRKPGQSS